MKTIFVIHGYGVTDSDRLPYVEQEVIQAAGREALSRRGEIIFITASWSAPNERAQKNEQVEKLEFLRRVISLDRVNILQSRAVANTADEILAWTELLRQESLFQRENEIVIFAARYHWGLKYLWNRHLREEGIDIPLRFVFVDKRHMWNRMMPSLAQQHTILWCLAGIVRVAAYLWWGIEARKHLSQHYKRKGV